MTLVVNLKVTLAVAVNFEGDSGSDNKPEGTLLLFNILSEILNCVSRSAHLNGTGNLKI